LALLPEDELHYESTRLKRLKSGSLVHQGIEDFAVITLRGAPVAPNPDTDEETSHGEDDDEEEKSDGWVEVNSVDSKAYSTLAKELEKTKKACEMLAREYSKELQTSKKKENKQRQDGERDREAMKTQIDNLKATLRTYEQGVKDVNFLHQKSLPFRCLAFRDFIFSKCEILLAGSDDDVSLPSLSADLSRFLGDPDPDRVGEFIPRVRDERTFVSRLKQLKTRIVNYIPQTFSGTVEEALSMLKEISPMGAETVRYIERRNLLGVFNSRRRMKQLLTHILCLAFHERILSSFVPGIDLAFSRKLYLLQNYIITRGIAPAPAHQTLDLMGV
jgi:hypothetical protein